MDRGNICESWIGTWLGLSEGHERSRVRDRGWRLGVCVVSAKTYATFAQSVRDLGDLASQGTLTYLGQTVRFLEPLRINAGSISRHAQAAKAGPPAVGVPGRAMSLAILRYHPHGAAGFLGSQVMCLVPKPIPSLEGVSAEDSGFT